VRDLLNTSVNRAIARPRIDTALGSIIEWRNIHVRHFIEILGRLEFRFSDHIGRIENIYGEVFT
jgi:hypothetical protein